MGRRDKLRGARPVMPAGVRDRKAEVWRALLAIADAAGGHWPDKARDACEHFVLNAKADDASIGVRLLGDLLGVFRDKATGEIAPVMWTEHILHLLNALDEAPWGNWYTRTGKSMDARALAKLLKPYGVKSGTVRIGEETAKGYQREDLWDPWTRYGVLSGVSVTSVTRVTPLASTVTDVTDVTDNGLGADDQPATLLDNLDGTRPCGSCSRPFHPVNPWRAICDRCVPTLAAATQSETP